MNVTRQWWGELALAVALAVGAVVLDQPLLFVGTVGLGAWLLATQAVFARRAAALSDSIAVEQRVTPDVVAVDNDVTVTVAVTLSAPVPYDVRIAADPPVSMAGTTADDRTLTIPAGETEGSTTVSVQPQIAGRHTFARPTVTVETAHFASQFASGSTSELTVEPRAPRDVHVGAGGDRLTAPFGETKTGERGRGLEPAGIRRYLPGDPADQIEWRATARQGEPYVLEFESEVDRRTMLVVDSRATMGEGPAGETKLDYARQVALSYLRAAQRADEPVGLYTIGDEGLRTRSAPAAEPSHYAHLRTTLHDLAVLPADGTHEEPPRPGVTVRSPAEAETVTQRLRGEHSSFARSLRPFFTNTRSYVQRTAGQPLYETLARELSQLRGNVAVIVFTDDTHRQELRESLRAARREGHHTVAFLTPSVLFDAGGLADLDGAYEHYVDFETFRQDLASSERIEAYEVGPRDRVEALLATSRRRVRS